MGSLVASAIRVLPNFVAVEPTTGGGFTGSGVGTGASFYRHRLSPIEFVDVLKVMAAQQIGGVRCRDHRRLANKFGQAPDIEVRLAHDRYIQAAATTDSRGFPTRCTVTVRLTREHGVATLQTCIFLMTVISRLNAGLSGLALVLVCCLSTAAETPVKSGLQAGEKLTATFEALVVNGEQAGELRCLVCANGMDPVAMIFAREVSEPLVKLIAKLEARMAADGGRELGCFVVFLGEQEKLQPILAEVARKQRLKHVILSIDAAAGPAGFNVARDADVTVVLYREHAVRANHAFAKGRLTDQSADAILADLPKILKK